MAVRCGVCTMDRLVFSFTLPPPPSFSHCFTLKRRQKVKRDLGCGTFTAIGERARKGERMWGGKSSIVCCNNFN